MGKVVGSVNEFQRSVDIQLPSRTKIIRPNNLVYKLEIPSNDESVQENGENQHSHSKDNERRNTHPMITRSKSRLNKTSATLAVITLLQLISTTTGNNRCPMEIATHKKVIFATNCSTRAAAIATYVSELGEKIWWFPVNCPMEAIRSDFPFHGNSTICGKPCDCPAWALQYSFTNSDRILESEKGRLPLHFMQYQPPKVRSFSQSPSCNPKKSIGVFNQILLFDCTIIIVENLTITIKEYIDESDFICVDKEGRRRAPTKK
ncbi:hypothetical protein RB195_024037 [Necator americanus]|uniref:Phlebovirus glycoprotein G2 fusion domain-containing protein n=1 Tax=Necator americanus TaxID=51031 RepID=A0ABR1ELQ8_NECAM